MKRKKLLVYLREHSEIDEALLDLIQRFEEADNERKKDSIEKKSKSEEELQKAQEIRKMSLELMENQKNEKIMQREITTSDADLHHQTRFSFFPRNQKESLNYVKRSSS